MTTEVRTAGDGPALLLIQGLGTDHRAWDPVVAHLAPHLRCITYDNRGVGAASPAHPSLTVEELADDAAELIRSLGDEPLHVAGVSLGGAIAMNLASRYPELVRSLALHSAAAYPDARTTAVLNYRKKILEHGLAADFLRPFVALWGWSPDHMTGDLPEGAAEITAMAESNYAAHLHAASSRAMSDEELGKISSPTLITVGTEDILTTPDRAAHLHRAIPDSRLVTIEGGGHAYYAEVPQLFASVQLGWVLTHA
ncbi:alpha/beta fold hydrolase [Acrocarpospora catenulata]|uniref:alpha/beta fold hydrolase n=1 Tax=Acrocarpospora catenulata TaxID=2836182 RepID=UPI001BDB5CE7|nr:alpha/beta fold hydrolase [Acrocarpospora catenulata]